MGGPVLAVRLILAGILLLAAVGKLRRPGGAATGAAELGLPPRIAGAVGVALPAVELALAIGLLLRPSAWLASLLSCCLFLAFTLVVGVNLAGGRRPVCACFGAGARAPISGWTLLRNVALTAAAGATVAFSAPSVGPDAAGWLVRIIGPTERLAWLTTAFGVLAAAASAVLVGRRAGAVDPGSGPRGDSQRDWSPATDAAAPRMTLQDLEGRSHPLWGGASHEATTLVFVEAGCGPCRTLDADIAAWRRDTTGPRVTVIGRGTVRALNAAFPATLATGGMLVDADGSAATALGVRGTPSVVVVNAQGRVTAGTAGPEGVRALVAGLGAAAAVPAALPRGASLAGVTLARTGGGVLSLGAVVGGLSLLVFWDPRCQFCVALLPRLLLWEREDPHHGVRLLLAVRRAVDADLRLQGFAAVAVVDADQALLRAVGGRGTPSALVIGADGRVASDLAVGGDAVIALAQRSSRLTAVARSLVADGRNLATVVP